MFKNKYLVLFQQNLHDLLIYRARLIIIVLSSFVAPLVMMWILSSLPGQFINGMSKKDLVAYYLTTSILYLFLNSKIDSYVKESIQQGEIANYLVKPISFWGVALIKDISGRFVKLVFGLPLFILLVFIYSIQISVDINLLVQTTIMILISFLLSFTFSFSVGSLAFWIEEVWGIQHLKEVAVSLLSGIVLPYTFFPETLQKFLVFTPFPYLVNWSLHKGFSGNLILEFILAVFWLIMLIILNLLMWKNGIKKYSALGTY